MKQKNHLMKFGFALLLLLLIMFLPKPVNSAAATGSCTGAGGVALVCNYFVSTVVPSGSFGSAGNGQIIDSGVTSPTASATPVTADCSK
jgi:hypothetical protein